METIQRKQFDEERALYGVRGLRLEHCAFDGPADGESALKEASAVEAEGCFFNLRYPFWHDTGLSLTDCELTPLCRAALWYSRDIHIQNSRMYGIKALRECADAHISHTDIVSPEFGWSTAGLTLEDVRADSEYFLLRARELTGRRLHMKGKYSFQYVENAVLEGCVLDTKDAFWHSKNVTLRDCVVKGEYLGWYAEGLTLIRCKISGTQPLCYCKNLRLEDCSLTEADLCFERSEVEATLNTPVVSVKNPRSGSITLPGVGEIIMDDPEARGTVRITG